LGTIGDRGQAGRQDKPSIHIRYRRWACVQPCQPHLSYGITKTFMGREEMTKYTMKETFMTQTQLSLVNRQGKATLTLE
jgi:hypothetical protein